MTELMPCPEPSDADYSNTLDSVRDYVYYLECKIISLEKRHTPDVDALEAAQKRIAELEARSDWQPIETAPLDKWLILGYFNHLDKWRVVRGNWIREGDLHDLNEEQIPGEGWYETAENADELPNVWKITPTHWMPLPDAPKNKEKTK